MTGLQVSCCAQIRLYSLLKWWLYKDHKQKSINSFVNKKQERMHFYLNDSTVIREMLILARARITLSTKVQKKIRLDFQPSNECRLSRHSGNAVKAVRWCWCTQHQPHPLCYQQLFIWWNSVDRTWTGAKPTDENQGGTGWLEGTLPF